LAAGATGPISAGTCLIYRIEPSQLVYGGLNVQIVLRGPSTGSVSIDRIYISQTGGTKPYDAGSDLTAVYDPSPATPLVITADQVVTLPVINYSLDHNQTLLIAMDLNSAAASQLRFIDLPAPPPGQQPGVTIYVSPGAAAEAASPTRS